MCRQIPVEFTAPGGGGHVRALAWQSPGARATLAGMENPTVDTAETQDAELIVAEELLVEEISIDGMCGVY